MNKTVFYILGSVVLGSIISGISVDAASVNSAPIEQTEIVPFNNLLDYQILLTGSENGISTYSGTKDHIRLNFEADSKDIVKIIIAFDGNTSSSEKEIDTLEIMDVVNRLYPNKISDKKAAAERLEEKLSEMNQSRDEDIFSIEQIKVEAHINNGMVNLRITK